VIWFGLLGADGGLKLCEYAVKEGFQTALFGRSEFIGDGKLRETHQRLADVLEASLEYRDGG
jgi:hypothetical protein|tara:strand:- start:517 stop:702 length:186 start_codon:yes stop_codon:yes gene_type:complete